MNRKKTAGDEEVSMNEAAYRLGMTAQSVGVWATKEGAPVVLKAGRRYAVWPSFPEWYRQQLLADRAKPADFEEAKTRKIAAEAELAEYELEQARGRFVAVEDLDGRVGPVFDMIRAKLTSLPGRAGPRVLGAKDLATVVATLEAEVSAVLAELSA